MDAQIQHMRETLKKEILDQVKIIKNEIRSDIYDINRKVNKIQQKIMKQFQKIKLSLVERPPYQEKQNQKMRKQMMEKINDNYHQIQNLKAQFRNGLQDKQVGELQEVYNKKFEQLKSINVQKITKASCLIDPKQRNLNQFNFNGTKIQKRNGEYFQLLGKIPIAQKPINYFKVEKTYLYKMRFGIMNSKYAGDESSFLARRQHFIFYDIYYGDIYFKGSWVGAPNKLIHEGNRMEMRVFGNVIEWVVNQQYDNSLLFDHQSIGDPSINWVPFIVMLDKGDKLEWQ